MQKGLTLSANQGRCLNSCIFQIVPRETPQIGDDIGRLERRGSDLLVWASIANYCRLQGGTSGKGPACQCRRHKRLGFDPWVRMFPWRRTWQPTPVLFPGESHGQRSLVGYGPKELDVTEVTGHAHTCLHKPFSSYQRALWVRIFCRFMKAPPLNN